MDGKLQLGAIPAIFAGSRDITGEGTISITQAELIQENYRLQNFNKLLWLFFSFFFWSLNFFYGSWGRLPAQRAAHSSL